MSPEFKQEFTRNSLSKILYQPFSTSEFEISVTTTPTNPAINSDDIVKPADLYFGTASAVKKKIKELKEKKDKSQ